MITNKIAELSSQLVASRTPALILFGQDFRISEIYRILEENSRCFRWDLNWDEKFGGIKIIFPRFVYNANEVVFSGALIRQRDIYLSHLQ